MTILITGASGFSGTHLARRLRGQSRPVIGVARSASASAPLDDYYSADLCSFSAVEALLRKVKPREIYHLAGLAQGTTQDLIRNNVQATLHVLEAVRVAVPKARVLVVGSSAEYGPVPENELPITEQGRCRPSSAYGTSKHEMVVAALRFAIKNRLWVVVGRPFNIVGAGVPPTMLVGALLQRIRDAEASGATAIPVGRLDTERDFVAVSDVVHAYVEMLSRAVPGEVYNLCSGRPVSIEAIVRRLLSCSASPLQVRVDPALVRPGDVKRIFGCWSMAQKAFGFAPTTDLDLALRQSWEHEAGDRE